MKTAVAGPLSRDRNIIGGKSYERPGGVTYYSGIALARLGADTLVLGTCGEDIPPWPENESATLVRIPAAGTIEFINEYATADCDCRRQRAVVHENTITPAQLDPEELSKIGRIILGPLIHDNISPALVEFLAGFGKLALAVQGLIRYLENGKIIWAKPERVLPMLPFCEYAAMDESELRFISGREELDEGARVLLDAGAAGLIVTRGSEGSVLYIDAKRYDIPAFGPQRIVDPTGAGDSYLAGFIRALDLYDDPVRQGEFAAMTATISLENSGAFRGSADSVLQRLGWG
ncbi:MAG: hypothetical protein FVQ81_15605 [Candidatus Glassbacteria bacterium]|nr:hypothetical protein [Candidatus Glassbacteria bacterium]